MPSLLRRPWTDFFVVNDPASSIVAAKQEIEALIATTLDVNLAPKFVRLGFHDCVPDALFQGGCDGCVDLSNPDNAGLDSMLLKLSLKNIILRPMDLPVLTFGPWLHSLVQK